MELTARSFLWGIALSLFLGSLGFPIPENPLLIGGGYALAQGMVNIAVALPLWFSAIVFGDLVVFFMVKRLFAWSSVRSWIFKLVGEKRLQIYQQAFLLHGGWTLFLARFTFGIRAAAYVAAGIASYPWSRFLSVDGVSVAVQLLLFVSLGYFAGDQISWAQATGRTIALLLTAVVLLSLGISWLATIIIRRFTKPSNSGHPMP